MRYAERIEGGECKSPVGIFAFISETSDIRNFVMAIVNLICISQKTEILVNFETNAYEKELINWKRILRMRNGNSTKQHVANEPI